MNKDIKNVIPVLTLMLVSIMFSCSHKKVKESADKVPSADVSTPTPTPAGTTQPVDVGVANVKLVPQSMATKDEVAFLAKAEKKMNEVIQSKAFFDFMLNRNLVDTNGKTPREVAAHLQGISGTINVKYYFTKMKSRFNPFGTSVVAYRKPPSNDININRAYYDPSYSSVCEFAGTLAHESVCHSLGGYDHDYYDTTERPFSVCYSINTAFEKLCH